MMRRGISCLVLFGILFQLQAPAKACGPPTLQPIFVFDNSPDLPFKDFAAGKIGIVKPTFGRKTLLIAYRYLNGGSFTADEQAQLVEALEGKPPEDDGERALKEWLATRKEYFADQDLPEIYTERKVFGGYDFFPNCAKNAFEVATATLKARVTSYGTEDPNIREWIRGQDEVFQNCSGGPTVPRSLGPEAPQWLRKDREYQIAAALFYSLQFDEARARLRNIAADAESDWNATAEYLVARAFVREASLTDDVTKKAELYVDAKRYLEILLAKGNRFRDASKKLMGLLKYRAYAQERVSELAKGLGPDRTSDDLRQDVIDYVWLLAKFEGQILEAEHKRREALKEKPADETSPSTSDRSTYDAITSGELIQIFFAPKLPNGEFDHTTFASFRVKPDTPEAEIFRLVEEQLKRKLSAQETIDLKEQIKTQLNQRKWNLSHNRKLDNLAREHGACYLCYDLELAWKDLPSFLTADDLTDWILTFQIDGPDTYTHAVAKWRETASPAWLAAALAKAQMTSRAVSKLIEAGERIASDSAAYPTVTFHLVRLKAALGKKFEAQQKLDAFIATQFDRLPVSARNEFQAQRMHLSTNVGQFLKFAARQPAAFWDDRIYRTIEELIEQRKAEWSAEYFDESKDEYATRLQRRYQNLTAKDVALFDESTADILDHHFSVQMLAQAAFDPALSAYLRRRLMMVAWTRAMLLKKEELALKIAPEVIKAAPEMTEAMTQYLQAKTATERNHSAIYLLVKFPGLTPFVSGTLPEYSTAEEEDYYLDSGWWCKPAETEYRNGEEVRKTVPAPPFLDRHQLQDAHQEFTALADLGDANVYLAKQVLEWATSSPHDPRVPEALFVAAKANESYKYGCNGWQNDEELKQRATTILLERYPQSQWAARVSKSDQP